MFVLHAIWVRTCALVHDQIELLRIQVLPSSVTNPSSTFKSLSCEVLVHDHLEYLRLLKEWIMEEQSINGAFLSVISSSNGDKRPQRWWNKLGIMLGRCTVDRGQRKM